MLGHKKLAEISSAYSGKIKIYSLFGNPRMEVGGLLQSGGVIRTIWKKAFRQVKKLPNSKSVDDVLVLGLGAGTVVEELVRAWPQCQVTGVEIDREVVRIGRDHFQLKKLEQSNLKIVISDAVDYVKKTAGKYDLVIVDIYCGKEFVDAVWQGPFLKNVKKLMRKDGIVIFNHLFWGKHKPRAKQFVQNLEKHFASISLSRVLANLLSFAYD